MYSSFGFQKNADSKLQMTRMAAARIFQSSEFERLKESELVQVRQIKIRCFGGMDVAQGKLCPVMQRFTDII